MTVPVRPVDPTADPIKVNVGLGERAYDVVIGRGLLATLGPNLAAMRPGAKAAIVTEERVAGFHLAATEEILRSAGVPSVRVVLPAGEKTKSFRYLEQVCDELISGRIERGDLVIALGGGVIGDLAGFAASVVRRGVDYVQVPTTLLAQVDSSVGGKTAINSAKGKNLIGAFYQPIHVVADTALLDTLPKRDFRAGYAEVVKYGLLGDREFFEWLEANWQEVFAGGPARGNLPAPREYAVLKSVQAKADIVARDEHEHGDRMLLNLGHTFGHAFEAAAGFSDRLLHGEAVALGMSLAFEFSARKGLISQADADRVIRHLAAVGLPTHVNDIPGEWPDIDSMMDLIAQDKKVKRGRLTFILVRGIGQAFVTRDIEAAEIRAFLAEKLAQR
jgi:3-dehydroquinate synthase